MTRPRPGASRHTLEFVGVAGAGKSTVAEGVTRELSAAGVSVAGRSDVLAAHRAAPWFLRVGSQLPSGARGWAVVTAAMGFARAGGVPGREALRRSGKLVALVRDVALGVGAERAQVLVLDQGPLQSVASMIMTTTMPSLPLLRRLLEALYPDTGTTLVHCVIDVETAWARISERPTALSRFDRWSEAEAKERLMRHAEHVAVIVGEAALAGLQTVVIDGTVPADENAAGIVRQTLAHLDSADASAKRALVKSQLSSERS